MSASIATHQTALSSAAASAALLQLEAAECGKQVTLAERNTSLRVRTALLNRYFPKICHPTCGLEINLRRLKGNRNLRVMTQTEVVSVTGTRVGHGM